MSHINLKTRFRAQFNRAVLNPLFTKAIDWFAPTKSLGAFGERCAERHLRRLGLIIVERNYKNLTGEIDLIAIDDRTVVFVEVKTRSSDIAGLPAEAVDERKQQQIAKAATVYLKDHELLECRARFDVVSVIWPKSSNYKDHAPEIEHFRHAFAVDANAW